MLSPAFIAQLGLKFELHVELQIRAVIAAVDAAAENVEDGHHVTFIFNYKIERMTGGSDQRDTLPRVKL